MTDAWDSAGYIASSRYRRAVCRYLSEHGSGLPSRIAAETNLAQPHVSRALSELREREIVELLVPESQQKGRLYGLTDLGELAYERVALDQEAEVTVVDPGNFPSPELIEELELSYGDSLRAVVWCEPVQTWVRFFSPSLADRYDEETMKTLVSTLTNEEALDEPLAELSIGAPDLVAFAIEETLVVRIPLDDEVKLLVSLDVEFDTVISDLRETCQQLTTMALDS
ncbi:ArsR family transcriptional regulator [Haloferax mediterranei ATCC 33500]|uniref:Transcriptional regulator n=1 Tax=Haloferax mediterranei (strain ATCC 33500 / DSM 1411 / JCM 8866 / NBRC 14739 / NCIMB 2177 / R-4) TaxID=523841 RepID=I3R4N0_HALMT|nr:winged helix-turn-helix domain-containing protein [Haloferax mediterranei]AFK19190.1 transcription regulator [Haloferax mediterranei ATCC 33500]AHZ21448.1 transcriptional regulator [Haloferax mediterranei ATCC 33500]EMA03907.1 transcriptional regulator [Haloferax mediterranei ATCC 33500]MDX5989289.1 winged helix-turn-helix domain-containing protein [Haloferax mediterranei ATCC 33500]QCQ75660.1 ArsR family transcriptional regulator [Haloferax mediterranei ATCC 33500]